MILFMILVSSCPMAGLAGLGICLAVGPLVTGWRKGVGLLDTSSLMLVVSTAIGELTSVGEDFRLAPALGSTTGRRVALSRGG